LATQAVKLDPDFPPAHMMLGEVEVADGKIPEGIKELETARDGQPSTPRIHWDLFRAYTAAGRTEDAKREKQVIGSLASANSPANPGAVRDKNSSEHP
jgi:uncharacterized membrane-anchored protein